MDGIVSLSVTDRRSVEVKMRNDGERSVQTVLGSVRVYSVADMNSFDDRDTILKSGRESVRLFLTWACLVANRAITL